MRPLKFNLNQLNLSVRKFIYDKFFNPNIKNNSYLLLDRSITALIIINLFGMLIETVPAIYQSHQSSFHLFDQISILIFSIEYVLRIYVIPEDLEFSNKKNPRIAYFFSPFALIDLIAILPFYLGAFVDIDLRILRALRLLRLFKLFRTVAPAFKAFNQQNHGATFRKKLYLIVYDSEKNNKLHEIFDFFIILWVIISVVCVVLESISSFAYYFSTVFSVIDTIAVGIFSTEYLMRLYSCVENPKYQHWLKGRLDTAKEGANIIDLLSILPFFLEAFLGPLFDLRFLRVFRLMRLLKLMRYSDAAKALISSAKKEWPVMKASLFIMLLLVLLSACLGYVFEHDAQPDKFENIPQSIYWAVITLASVGYGDIAPITPMGRFITIILALVGIGIFAIPAAVLSSSLGEQIRVGREKVLNDLYSMLSDGVLSPEERQLIDIEAKKFKISNEEVDQLVERAKNERRQRESDENRERLLLEILNLTRKGQLDFEKCAQDPKFAAEQFKTTLNQLQQLLKIANIKEMQSFLEDENNSTPIQLKIAKLLMDKPQ
jgi:voltage-gated potassium channel